MNSDYIFKCEKCGYLICTNDPKKLINLDCPQCGEDWSENYVFVRMGVFNKELHKE